MRSLSNIQELPEDTAIVKFFAEWCGPCKLFEKVYERAAARNPSAEFFEVDIDQAPEIAEKFGVKSVPTTIALRGGEEFDRVLGAKSTARFEHFLTDVLQSPV